MRKTYPVAKGIKLKAIVARCLDRRFRVAHRRFIEEKLKLAPENIVPIKRAGGAGPLRWKKRGIKKLPKDLVEQIDLFIEHHPEIKLIILFNHEDCRRYDKIKEEGGKPNQEKIDLKEAVQLFAKRHPKKKFKGYYARFLNKKQKRIYFKLVAKN